MSRHMQITVTIRPFYQKSLEKTYPRLARHLAYQDPGLVEKNPSLYELAGQTDMLLYRYDGTPLRQVLLADHKQLEADEYQTFEAIEENIQTQPPTGTWPKRTNCSTPWKTSLMTSNITWTAGGRNRNRRRPHRRCRSG
jgi:hypothetical protein